MFAQDEHVTDLASAIQSDLPHLDIERGSYPVKCTKESTELIVTLGGVHPKGQRQD